MRRSRAHVARFAWSQARWSALKLVSCLLTSRLDCRYLATDHKVWYTIIERLERQIRAVPSARLPASPADCYADDWRAADTLIALYDQLGERDAAAALWRRRACIGIDGGESGVVRTLLLLSQVRCGGCGIANSRRLQGLCHEARLQARIAMNRGVALLTESATGNAPRTDIQPTSADQLESPNLAINSRSPAPPTSAERPATRRFDIRAIDGEMRALERLYVAACRELNDWEALASYANTTAAADARTLADAAWHVAEWATVGELVPQIEASGKQPSGGQLASRTAFLGVRADAFHAALVGEVWAIEAT